MRNALQKHAHRGFGTIREREPRSERATATAGTPQRRSTDRRESNAKAVARTKGRKASPARYRERGQLRSPFGKLTIWDMVTAKASPAREEKETRGAYGGERKTGAHAEEAGTRRRAQGAQAHLPEPGQITLRPQSVRTESPTSPKCHTRRVMPSRMRCRRLARSGTSRCRCPRR